MFSFSPLIYSDIYGFEILVIYDNNNNNNNNNNNYLMATPLKGLFSVMLKITHPPS